MTGIALVSVRLLTTTNGRYTNGSLLAFRALGLCQLVVLSAELGKSWDEYPLEMRFLKRAFHARNGQMRYEIWLGHGFMHSH